MQPPIARTGRKQERMATVQKFLKEFVENRTLPDRVMIDVSVLQEVAAELARLQAIEAAARDVVASFELDEKTDRAISRLAAALDRKP